MEKKIPQATGQLVAGNEQLWSKLVEIERTQGETAASVKKLETNLGVIADLVAVVKELEGALVGKTSGGEAGLLWRFKAIEGVIESTLKDHEDRLIEAEEEIDKLQKSLIEANAKITSQGERIATLEDSKKENFSRGFTAAMILVSAMIGVMTTIVGTAIMKGFGIK